MFHCGPEYLSWYSDSVLDRSSGDLIPNGARFSILVKPEPVTHPARVNPGSKATWTWLGHSTHLPLCPLQE